MSINRPDRAAPDRLTATDPEDSHSGEGTDSLRHRLARKLADTASRVAGRQPDALSPASVQKPTAPPAAQSGVTQPGNLPDAP